MNIFISSLISGAFLVALIIFIKDQKEIKNLRLSFTKLSQSFEELDEQAKLIVKTDLELNKTQEELDKRIDGLDALQKLSRAINTTLDENEIFSRLSFDLLNSLGFEKYMFLLFSGKKDLQTKRLFNFSEKEKNSLHDFFNEHTELTAHLREGSVLSSLNISAEEKKQLSVILNTEDFVFAPILVQNSLLGLAVAGTHSPAYFLTEGDAEIISILADQLGQAIENARLFEEVYTSRQELEQNIQDRTRQLTEALERVQKINKTKSEFISAVSHELRTPLTSIKGYASILMAEKIGKIPDPVKERLEKINKHSDNLVSLINNLLDISRIESGKAELKFKFQSLTPVIEIIEDLLTPQLKEKNIIFQKHIASDLPEVYIDSSQIERVFINLVGNAIKFTPPEGIITISANIDGKSIVVSVSDTGIGLKKEDSEKLFDEFYRVENEINQNVKGTGLGLSLAKRIVEAHKGTIAVKSSFGEGTAFYFTLPTLNIQKESKDKLDKESRGI